MHYYYYYLCMVNMYQYTVQWVLIIITLYVRHGVDCVCTCRTMSLSEEKGMDWRDLYMKKWSLCLKSLSIGFKRTGDKEGRFIDFLQIWLKKNWNRTLDFHCLCTEYTYIHRQRNLISNYKSLKQKIKSSIWVNMPNLFLYIILVLCYLRICIQCTTCIMKHEIKRLQLDESSAWLKKERII